MSRQIGGPPLKPIRAISRVHISPVSFEIDRTMCYYLACSCLLHEICDCPYEPSLEPVSVPYPLKLMVLCVITWLVHACSMKYVIIPLLNDISGYFLLHDRCDHVLTRLLGCLLVCLHVFLEPHWAKAHPISLFFLTGVWQCGIGENRQLKS